jgi:hypothetical protein
MYLEIRLLYTTYVNIPKWQSVKFAFYSKVSANAVGVSGFTGKLLQNLLDPVVIIFRSIYIYVRHSDQKSCLSQKYLCHRNYEKVRFWSILARHERICSEVYRIISYIYFIYMIGYTSILPTSPAFESRYFLQNWAHREVLGKCDTQSPQSDETRLLNGGCSCDLRFPLAVCHSLSRCLTGSPNCWFLTRPLDLLTHILPHHVGIRKNM